MRGEVRGQVAVQFSQRLSHLMETVHPAGRGPYTLAEVVAGIAEHGVTISVPYLSHLRNGTRANPKSEIVTALAEFFKVSPAYFYDATYAKKIDQDLDLIVQLRDSKVREIAERSYGLSEGARQVVADMVNHLRTVEGLSDEPSTQT
ncbi:helix-turn-helix domain-containing protein [Mycobacteroides abscessus]|nr:helix-turn-helix transcriptional regulator [Mycobacteroides abscessus]RIT57530.1 XRE family transcriptional regulator [Mycobacteroides abscessus]